MAAPAAARTVPASPASVAGPGAADLVPGPAGNMDADLCKLPRFAGSLSRNFFGVLLF
jgi:hypothetical protein